jgi:hypothetical protein
LWDKKYKLELLALEYDNIQVLESINFSWINIEYRYKSGLISSETSFMSTHLMSDIFTNLLKKNIYNKDIEWKKAKLVIKQA